MRVKIAVAPPTAQTMNGAQSRRDLVRRFDGDFHRVTCRNDGDLNSDSHTGFRLSRTSQRPLNAGRSYLVPNSKSFDRSRLEAIIFRTSPADHLNVLVALYKRVNVGHQVFPFANCYPALYKLFADFHRRKAIRMGGEDSPDGDSWTDGRVHNGRRLPVKFQITIANLFPRIQGFLDALEFAFKLGNLVLCFRELRFVIHTSARIV